MVRRRAPRPYVALFALSWNRDRDCHCALVILGPSERLLSCRNLVKARGHCWRWRCCACDFLKDLLSLLLPSLLLRPGCSCVVVNAGGILRRLGGACFAAQGRAPLEQMRRRLMLDVPDEQLRERVRQLVLLSHDHMNTYLYDKFQRMSNGIEF